MYWIQLYGKEIVAILVPIITFSLNKVFKGKAKLLIANPHTFTFIVQNSTTLETGEVIPKVDTIHTRSHLLKNEGKESASQVELVFNWKPLCTNVWPLRRYSEHTLVDGRYSLMFDSLAPNETIGCEILSINHNLPDLVYARCDECVGRNIDMYPQPVAKQWVTNFVIVLLFFGLAAFVYSIIVLLQFLILKTPIAY